MFEKLISFIQEQYGTNGPIALHEPRFAGREREYVLQTIETGFVSSVGGFVDRFEHEMAAYCGAERAVAVVNGTAALHLALKLAGVERDDLVITQPLTFVATCNAIAYLAAAPVFVDVDFDTMGLSPEALEEWLATHARVCDDGLVRETGSGKVIRACVPMHTFGHPARIEAISSICAQWGIVLVEDAAEALGSLKNGRHVGIEGLIGTLSFNGNKPLTTGGGGMIIADAETGARAKHLSTTAKRPHPFEYYHDEVGFNYRMPNLNAALGCAQLEQLDMFIAAKRALAARYDEHLRGSELQLVREPTGARSNYWLNAVICCDREHRNAMLAATNASGVMTRPIWTLMHRLPAYAECLRGELPNAEQLEARVVNLPSSAILGPKG